MGAGRLASQVTALWGSHPRGIGVAQREQQAEQVERWKLGGIAFVWQAPPSLLPPVLKTPSPPSGEMWVQRKTQDCLLGKGACQPPSHMVESKNQLLQVLL